MTVPWGQSKHRLRVWRAYPHVRGAPCHTALPAGAKRIIVDNPLTSRLVDGYCDLKYSIEDRFLQIVAFDVRDQSSYELTFSECMKVRFSHKREATAPDQATDLHDLHDGISEAVPRRDGLREFRIDFDDVEVEVTSESFSMNRIQKQDWPWMTRADVEPATG